MKITDEIYEVLKSRVKEFGAYEYSDYENPFFMIKLVELLEEYGEIEVEDDVMDMIDDFYGM